MINILLSLAAIITNNLYIPDQFRGNNTEVVHFTNQRAIDKACGKAHKGLYTMACEFEPNVIYMPNPCKDREANNPNSYAHLLCHELAHSNGWVHADD